MRKMLLCLAVVVLSVSPVFGNATDDLFDDAKYITPSQARALIKFGADVNAKNNWGETVLMKVARLNKDPEVIKVLLNAGADVNAKSNYGDTALMAAAQTNDNPEFTRVLLKAGANVNDKDNGGQTALWKALRTPLCNLEIVKLLLEAGADTYTYTITNTKETALMHAALFCENLEVIKILLAIEDDLNARDISGCGVLFYAAVGNGNPDVMRLLLSAGLNVNDRDKNGETVLMHAAHSNRNPEVVKVLIDAGADLFAKDKEGKTVLDHAGDEYVVKQIILNAAQ